MVCHPQLDGARTSVLISGPVRALYREEPCKTALNRTVGMPFRWTLNPYMGCVHRCTYCYVRAYEKRADRPADDRYGRSIRVKTNVATVLRQELQRRSWRHETVAIGAATDPYQPAEGSYKLSRACIEALAAARNPFGIITRGRLVIRDVDLLQEASRRAAVAVNVSVPTLDATVWRRTEPGTAPPAQRLRAIRALSDAGVRVNLAIAPILPGISDRPEQLEAVVQAAHDAGAAAVWANLLHLRPDMREHFLSELARDWPELLDHYRELYRASAYLSDAAQAPTLRRVAELRRAIDFTGPAREPIEPPPPPQQLQLFAEMALTAAVA